jgi:hypothetical protein
MKQDSSIHKAKFKKELANELGFSLKTFQRRLKDANIEIPRGLVCPLLQNEIFEKLGFNCPEMTYKDAK